MVRAPCWRVGGQPSSAKTERHRDRRPFSRSGVQRSNAPRRRARRPAPAQRISTTRSAVAGPSCRIRPEQLRHAERQIDGLAGVEAGVAGRGVAHVQLVLEDVAETAQALGDVVTGELDVHTAGPRAGLVVGGEEAARARPGCRRSAGSCAPRRWRRCCRAWGRTPTPPGARRRAPPRAAAAARRRRAAAPIRVISVSRPGVRSGFEALAQRQHLVGGGRWRSTLQPTGLWIPDRKSTWAPSSWRVRSPTHNMCAEQS